MHLYKTTEGNLLKFEEQFYIIRETWDVLINRERLAANLKTYIKESNGISNQEGNRLLTEKLLPPIESQEVWAAGVTYLSSRDARMEESEDAGAADCYQRVYTAERPELFFKAMPHRVAGHRQMVFIRKDSAWNVPEPELTLFLNSYGNIQAYTIGNDMSSRSIEGENPLYLPQAKMYEKSAALGPCLWVPNEPIDLSTKIEMEIYRGGLKLFEGDTRLSRMKRSLSELADWLFKELQFAQGVFLMTGTCVVPPNDFTLQTDDMVNIHIEGIGTLTNIVGNKSLYK
jgi:2-dehydro-3-deoxy-D-arabinonate dehydratase